MGICHSSQSKEKKPTTITPATEYPQQQIYPPQKKDIFIQQSPMVIKRQKEKILLEQKKLEQQFNDKITEKDLGDLPMFVQQTPGFRTREINETTDVRFGRTDLDSNNEKNTSKNNQNDEDNHNGSVQIESIDSTEISQMMDAIEIPTHINTDNILESIAVPIVLTKESEDNRGVVSSTVVDVIVVEPTAVPTVVPLIQPTIVSPKNLDHIPIEIIEPTNNV
jgi:hypothetical protein